MNPHILIVIDNQLNPDKYTQEQLKQNSSDAANAAYAAAAYANVNYTNAAYTAYVASAAYAAYAGYAGYDAAVWLNQYFEHTGENKQDYIDEINKDKQ